MRWQGCGGRVLAWGKRSAARSWKGPQWQGENVAGQGVAGEGEDGARGWWQQGKGGLVDASRGGETAWGLEV